MTKNNYELKFAEQADLDREELKGDHSKKAQ
jgi:hypothetical protein